MNTKKIATNIRTLLFKMAVKNRLLITEKDLPLFRIEQIVKQAMKAAEPNQLQKAVESAGYYLSDSELTIAEQVDLIAKAGEDEMLSNIPGVLEWEPIQGRYTASEFLDLIGY